LLHICIVHNVSKSTFRLLQVERNGRSEALVLPTRPYTLHYNTKRLLKSLEVAEFARYQTRDSIEAAKHVNAEEDADIEWLPESEEDPADVEAREGQNYLGFTYGGDFDSVATSRAQVGVPPPVENPDIDESPDSSEPTSDGVSELVSEQASGSDDDFDADVTREFAQQKQRGGRKERSDKRNAAREAVARRQLPPNTRASIQLQSKINKTTFKTTLKDRVLSRGESFKAGARKRKEPTDKRAQEKRNVLVESQVDH